MAKLLLLLARIAGYLALAYVLSGIGALLLVNGFGLCSTFNEAAIRCASPVSEAIANHALTVLLLTVFTGLPALLALVGLVFAIEDGVAWWKRRRALRAP